MPEALFEYIPDEPVAAASLAQVYRARVRGGLEVAVKLQRPGLAQSVALDATILRNTAIALRRVAGTQHKLFSLLMEQMVVDDMAGNVSSIHWSPHHRMPFDCRSRASNCLSMTWRAISARPYYLVKLRSDVVGIVDELIGRIFDEMDYRREADSIRRFYDVYKAGGGAGAGLAGQVRAPQVVGPGRKCS